MTIRRKAGLPKGMLTEITIGKLTLTTYQGSPWLGVEIMRGCLFVTLFGRRFEFRVLK